MSTPTVTLSPRYPFARPQRINSFCCIGFLTRSRHPRSWTTAPIWTRIPLARRVDFTRTGTPLRPIFGGTNPQWRWPRFVLIVLVNVS